MGTKVMTNGYILEKDKILLGMKKRGVGAGRWNGFGGKVHEGETIEEGMKREFAEECGISVSKSEQFGRIEFSWNSKPDIFDVHFFRVLEYTGTPTETEEMKPQWFNTNEIPYSSMWKDDPHWMPMFLNGKKFAGKILFDEKDNVITADIKEVENFR